jgi:hypothetical protein
MINDALIETLLKTAKIMPDDKKKQLYEIFIERHKDAENFDELKKEICKALQYEPTE